MWQEMQWEFWESQLVIFTALVAAKWAEIKALWWLHISPLLVSLSPPILPRWMNLSGGHSHTCVFPQTQWRMQLGTEIPPTPLKTPLSCSKRITNWIFMWYIHYRKILCCSPLKAHHPPLPSTFHRTHISPNTTTPAPFIRPLTLAVLNWAKSKFNISGGWLGCLKSSPQRAARVITAVTCAPVKRSAHDYTLCCFVVSVKAFFNHQLRN